MDYAFSLKDTMVTTFSSIPPLRSSLCDFALSSLIPGHVNKKKKHSHRLFVKLESIEGSASEGTFSRSVTRRLVLLRHADSSWNNFSLRDHERPLSKAGRADAITVSHKLQQLGWVPDLILCSDALRTRETLSVMQEQIKGFLHAAKHFIPSFYSVAAMDGQTAEHLQQMICKYSTDDILTVMCMGHNRGWEEAASMLSGTKIELKTCNAALLQAPGKSWDEAFALAGLGGWKLHGVVKPDSGVENYLIS